MCILSNRAILGAIQDNDVAGETGAAFLSEESPIRVAAIEDNTKLLAMELALVSKGTCRRKFPK